MRGLTPDEMMERFENGTLAEEEFGHAGHVKMAFLYLRKYRLTEVLERFPAGLMQFAAARGKAGLYHETITWAYILLIQEQLTRMGREATWEEFAKENEEMLREGKSYLKRFYREETIGSDLAKKTFVFPDRNVVSG